MPRPSRIHLPSPNSVNFNLHAPKESGGCARPPLLTPLGSLLPSPSATSALASAPAEPPAMAPRARRARLPPHGARRADWVPAPPERGSGSGAALIGCGAGSTPSSRRAAAAPALTERDAGAAARGWGRAEPPRSGARSAGAARCALRAVC